MSQIHSYLILYRPPTSSNDSTAMLGTWVVAILCKQGYASNGCTTNEVIFSALSYTEIP